MNEDLLRRIPLFASFPPEELRLLARTMKPAVFPAGAVLFREGDPGENFSIITEGQVEIIQAFETPEERVLGVEGPGDFLGEVSLLDPQRTRSAAARALTDVHLLEMTSADFEGLLHRHAPLAVAMLREMSGRLRRSESQTIRELQEKNRRLAQALDELQAAQQQLLEKEILEQELRLARAIQEGTLPKELPVLPGWDITTYWQPAHAVGGDFYDFIPLPDGRLALLIGDVSGKGIPAALIMATTRSLLRFAALNPPGAGDVKPGEVLARVNDMIAPEIPASMFVTCWMAVVDPQTGRACFANAGHNLPYQRAPHGLTELHAVGMPLGLLPGMAYDENETLLSPGDGLILYSDGLVEAHSPRREMFGTARLRDILSFCPPGAGLIQTLLDHLAQFTGPNYEQEDDTTCVLLERSPG